MSLSASFYTFFIKWMVSITSALPIVVFDKLQFIEHISTHFLNLWFIFHVSFLCFNVLIINTFKGWNIILLCFILSFMFHFSKHCGSDSKTPRERFHAPTEVLNRSHRGFKSLPQCFSFSPSVFLEWNIETKNET